MDFWTDVCEQISNSTGQRFTFSRQHALGGGDINSAYLIESKEGVRYFIKLNQATLGHMFEAEYHGLNELRQCEALHIPEPVCFGQAQHRAFLVMEYIEPRASGDDTALGEGLAALHEITQAQFGWFQDNTIGSTPQRNNPHDDWLSFWRDERLQPQLEMANANGFGSRLERLGHDLILALPELLKGHAPKPSLLHGDLWSGNYAYDRQGKPVIFDPAVYYGDKETDLAMTELFGGFSPTFYQAYRANSSLDDGYKKRKQLYNLYHILNHANLFGSAYASQAQHMMERLLA